MPSLLHRISFVIVCYAIFSASVAESAIIAGYSDATNDRFTNSPQFIASSYNLSGVGKSSGGQWATLVSRNTVVSAYHAQPSGNIFFYADNDPSSTPVTRQIIGSQRIGNSDLWIATLNQNVDASIMHYTFASTLLTGIPAPNATTFNVEAAGSFKVSTRFW